MLSSSNIFSKITGYIDDSNCVWITPHSPTPLPVKGLITHGQITYPNFMTASFPRYPSKTNLTILVNAIHP
jgi:hypothetical protein